MNHKRNIFYNLSLQKFKTFGFKKVLFVRNFACQKLSLRKLNDKSKTGRKYLKKTYVNNDLDSAYQ